MVVFHGGMGLVVLVLLAAGDGVGSNEILSIWLRNLFGDGGGNIPP